MRQLLNDRSCLRVVKKLRKVKLICDNYSLKVDEISFELPVSRPKIHLLRFGDVTSDFGVVTTSIVIAAPWDAKKKRLEREKDVTDLVLNRNKDRNKRKSKRLEDMSFSMIEKEFRKKVWI